MGDICQPQGTGDIARCAPEGIGGAAIGQVRAQGGVAIVNHLHGRADGIDRAVDIRCDRSDDAEGRA